MFRHSSRAKLKDNHFQVRANLEDLQQQGIDATNIAPADLQQSVKYNSNGLAHALKQEFTEALEDFNIALNSEDARIYFNRANVYLEQSQRQLALEDLNRAIALDPQLSERTYYNRAGIYNMRGQ